MTTNKKMSGTELFCWNYIQDHLANVSKMSITRLAEEAYVSPSTVDRVLKKMGYDGFADFKHSVKNNKSRPINGFSDEVNQAILKNETEITRTINQLSVEEIEKAVQLINSHENIMLIAKGLSSNVSREMMSKLQIFGKRCVSYDDEDYMKYHAGKMKPSDLLIAISITGETPEIISSARTAHNRGAKVLALTASPSSRLAREADLTLTAYKSKLKELDFGLDVASRIPLQIVIRILIDAFAIYKRNATIRASRL